MSAERVAHCRVCAMPYILTSRESDFKTVNLIIVTSRRSENEMDISPSIAEGWGSSKEKVKRWRDGGYIREIHVGGDSSKI